MAPVTNPMGPRRTPRVLAGCLDVLIVLLFVQNLIQPPVRTAIMSHSQPVVCRIRKTLRI
jgi:hypothetical protein